MHSVLFLHDFPRCRPRSDLLRAEAFSSIACSLAIIARMNTMNDTGNNIPKTRPKEGEQKNTGANQAAKSDNVNKKVFIMV